MHQSSMMISRVSRRRTAPLAMLAEAPRRLTELTVTGVRARALTDDEQRLVAAARALVTEPALILADDPAPTVLPLLDVLHAAGHTVITGTRTARVAARAGRIVALRDGVVVSDR